MFRVKLLVAVMCISLLSFISAHAALINGGFETGDLSGWSNNSGILAATVNSYSGDIAYSPVEGDYFLKLTSGLGTGAYSIVNQSLSLQQGAKLSGWAAFDAGDYLPYNDDAYVKIGNSTVWSRDISQVGNYGYTNWQQWNWEAPTAGSYTLEFGVRNVGDNGLSSLALFDANFLATSAVPEPATMSLFGLGLLGLGLIKRKK
ncbi:MAG: PEP-CTERM sorting domain-containing protein [Candidatus Omnitrophota bacterium]|jgi:hypothetical protein|nr:MAG: PEP-CTERM sorting domain-containing protein [Candidatus Omnitrophota bacterium]